MLNNLKTLILLSLFAGFFIALGGLIAGTNGIMMAFLISLLINFVIYYFSEKIVLKMYKAKKLDLQQYGFIYQMVEDLLRNQNLPMPKLWLVESDMANAFATGRNANNASLVVTSSLLSILDRNELRAVLAHEISHIKNKDILIGTIAAVLATSVSMLVDLRYMLYYKNNDKNKNGVLRFILLFLISIIGPLIATIIRAAISRSREYLADESGAKISQDPLALARALEKLQSLSYSNKQKREYSAIQNLFIVSPFNSFGLNELFSTHPPIVKRVEKLKKIYDENKDINMK